MVAQIHTQAAIRYACFIVINVFAFAFIDAEKSHWYMLSCFAKAFIRRIIFRCQDIIHRRCVRTRDYCLPICGCAFCTVYISPQSKIISPTGFHRQEGSFASHFTIDAMHLRLLTLMIFGLYGLCCRLLAPPLILLSALFSLFAARRRPRSCACRVSQQSVVLPNFVGFFRRRTRGNYHLLFSRCSSYHDYRHGRLTYLYTMISLLSSAFSR